jgi:hypothetical protein
VEELAAFSQREFGQHKARKVIKLVENLPKAPRQGATAQAARNLRRFRGTPDG